MEQEYKTKSMRLKSWDYTTPWWYFVTISTHNHKNYFGQIISGEIQLNEIGKVTQYEWLKTAELRGNVELDEYIIMPNHIHAIVILNEDNISRNVTKRDVARYVTTLRKNQYSDISPSPKSLSSIIRGFKSAVKKECNQLNYSFKWQPKFYDRIIRNEKELFNIRRYIQQNPLKWELDKGIPNNSDL